MRCKWRRAASRRAHPPWFPSGSVSRPQEMLGTRSKRRVGSPTARARAPRSDRAGAQTACLSHLGATLVARWEPTAPDQTAPVPVTCHSGSDPDALAQELTPGVLEDIVDPMQR